MNAATLLSTPMLLAAPMGLGALAGTFDMGHDDGWTHVSGSGGPAGSSPPIGDTAGANSTGLNGSSSWSHGPTGTSMSITAFQGNTLGGPGSGPNHNPAYEWTGTQIRSEFGPNMGNGNSSSSGDYSIIRLDLDFGTGVGCNGILAAGDIDNLIVSSLNGSSEAYEWGAVVFEDQFGNPLAGWNESSLFTYNPTSYQQAGAGAGTTMTQLATGSAAGSSSMGSGDWGSPVQGVFGWDDFNTTVDLTQPPASSGNPLSGTGGSNSFDIGDSTDVGFAATDTTAISGFRFYFGIVDVAPNDAITLLTDTNTNPSAGFSSFSWTGNLEPVIVPEPSRVLLLAIGSGLLLLRRRR